MVRKNIRRGKAAPEPAAKSTDDIAEIYYQHADGTVDQDNAPDVIGGVTYSKDPNKAPAHFLSGKVL